MSEKAERLWLTSQNGPFLGLLFFIQGLSFRKTQMRSSAKDPVSEINDRAECEEGGYSNGLQLCCGKGTGVQESPSQVHVKAKEQVKEKIPTKSQSPSIPERNPWNPGKTGPERLPGLLLATCGPS